MPSVSERQRRAMWAAAEGHSKIGIPEKVGKEFVEHDSEEEKALTPGGNYADPGFRNGVKRYPLDTHEHVVAAERFHAEEKNRAEYTEAQNAHIDKKIAAAKKKFGIDREDAQEQPSLEDMTDFEAAEAIRDRKLPSPTKFGDFWLFALRITGTGAAYRDKLDEYAVRDPEKWLSDEFVQRCNGLAVVFEHPENGGLDGEEFTDRVIGTTILPYVEDDEVWGIAKIYDEDAALLMQSTHTSTSPGVTAPKDSKAIELSDGTSVLDEDLPLILDHLAVCEAGVWDKGGPPEGVRLDAAPTREETDVTEEERKALEKERDDAKKRADAAEKELTELREDKKRKDAEELEGKELKDKKRKDSEEEDKNDESEEERDMKEAEKDGEKEHEAEERAEKDRKDTATAEVDANRLKELHDSSSKRIAELEAAIAKLSVQPSHEEADKLAAAFARADAAYQMLGERAPQPYPGESSLAFRRRAAAGLRKHSATFKDYAITDSLDSTAFGLIEDRIYADAAESTKSQTGEYAGVLVETKSRDSAGRLVSRFHGDSRVAWEPFMPPVQHVITSFNKPTPMGR